MASLEVLSIPDAFAFLKVLIPREPYLPAWPSVGIRNGRMIIVPEVVTDHWSDQWYLTTVVTDHWSKPRPAKLLVLKS